MNFILPEEIENIFTKMKSAGYEIYLVGGAVRDLIMGRPINDWDFTTNATPEEIIKIFPDSFYDNAFGTVGIPSNYGFTPHEITTFRTERGYSDNRRPDKIEWGKNLKDDVARRDFTINSIALTKDEGKIRIIDYYSGQDDIAQKIVRTVGDADLRFSEDALRMMRAVRIASELGFVIDQNTTSAIVKNASLINKIAKERIKDELFKLLSSGFPDQGILMMRNCGLLKEILPELDRAFGIEQKSPERHHIWDVGTHCVMSLKFCKSSDPLVRFATLIHDIGKVDTFRINERGIITFYNHEIIGTKIAIEIANRLRFSKLETGKLIRLVRWHQFSVDERQTDSAIRRFIKNVGIDNLEDMLILRTADRLGGGARETSWRLEDFKKRLVEVQKQPFSISDLKINGNDIMELLNLKPGPEVGKILSKIFKEVEDQKIENTKEALIEFVKKI